MISRKALTFWQKSAQTSGMQGKTLAIRGIGKQTETRVQACVLGPNHAPFRNPSPWRQSGANMYLLPPFFMGGAAAFTDKRELYKCRNSQNLVPLFCSSQRLLHVRPRRARFSLLQQARPSVQQPVPSSAVPVLTSLRVPSSVARLARSPQHSKPFFRVAMCGAMKVRQTARSLRGVRFFVPYLTTHFPAHPKDTACSTRS